MNNRRLPNFLLVGAQKSGTTSLIHYLGGHPDVFAVQDEIHYFDLHYERGIDWYLEHFALALSETAVGEGSPEYLYDDEAPKLAAEALPEALILAILRHPADRAYSHYWHNRTRGHEPLEFADAIAAEQERIDGADPETRSRFSYLDRGRYVEQLERWAEHYSRQSIAVVLFEDLVADRHSVVQGLYRFLGVDDTVAPASLREVKNPYVTFRSQRARRPLRRLPGVLRRVGVRLNTRMRATYPPLPAGLREEIAERFSSVNAELARRWELDLKPWNRP